jgi:ribulose-5-phosphate 4-epimerase/fuculose-1-phosphate aldolase
MMPEGYVGTKFRTVFASREPPRDARLGELVRWCRRFASLGIVGRAMGNVSFRTANGFIISPTGTDPSTIVREQFVEVLEADIAGRALTARGACEPSSESMMHAAIYAARPEINAVFHAHNDGLLAAADRLGLAVTEREQPYGTPELVAEIIKILGCHDFFIMRNHGFVALGGTIDEAGRRVEEMLGKI